MSKLDLHIHSNHSDGKLSVLELAEIIKKNELQYCALTDHNTVSGVQGLTVALKNTGITVIPGVELTAKYNNNEIHILAYDFDIDLVSEIIKERNEIVHSQKIKEMALAIKLYRDAGLKITDGLSIDENYPVTLTTALDICANTDNQNFFLKKFGKELTPEDVFYEYQAPGKSGAVERSGVTVEWIIQKFKGIAKDLIIAHPFVCTSIVAIQLNESRINDLLDAGLTGIEVYHNHTTTKQIELLENIIKEKTVHFTGGSDFHGRNLDTSIGQYGSDCFIPGFSLADHESD